MDGDLTRKLHGNLHLLSPESYERLKSHYAGNTLSSQEMNSLRNEITARLDMSRVHPLLD
jgi:hemolysin activation/secretion protein